MTQILDQLPDGIGPALLCSYTNVTSSLEILRIANVAGWYFERVIFPQERILFTAPASASLEVHSSSIVQMLIQDCVPCTALAVQSQPRKHDTELSHLLQYHPREAMPG